MAVSRQSVNDAIVVIMMTLISTGRDTRKVSWPPLLTHCVELSWPLHGWIWEAGHTGSISLLC